MTGGWAAKELTELGLRTLVLDAGRPIVPNKDYREHTPPWEMPFRGLGDRQTVARRQAVQRNSVTFDEMSHQFWVDDVDNPYSTPANKAFHWLRARQVGGKSIIWGRQVYRWSNLDFEANLRDGIGVDWPIRYADIAPWYDLVDRFIGVSTPGNTNHEMGTARMGRDPKTSVLNGWNQTWEVPNVFVTDGACMASSGNQNPSLTYMALTARACHYAVDAMKRGDL